MVFAKQNGILTRLIKLKHNYQSWKHAHENYKTTIGQIYNTMSGKAVMVHFPIVEKNLIYFSILIVVFSFSTTIGFLPNLANLPV